jgi:hypothetical protein
MNLGGLIGAVMKPAAEAGAKYAEKRIDLDIKKELMAAEEEKLLRIDEIKRKRDIADVKPKAEAVAEAAPILAGGEAAAAPIKAAGVAAAAPIQASADAAAQIIKTNTPGYLDSVTKEAGAKESLASRLQERLANLGIEEKRTVQALIKEYENPSTTPDRKAQIKDSLTVRGIIKPGEFDTEKVTTEATDEDGNIVKTERARRRTTPGGAASPPNSGPYKIGATRPVQSGPNKGKTVEWDGQGWKLKD